MPGQIIIAGPVGGGGLLNVTLDADEVEVLSGAGISTRQVTAGANPFTAASTANSGNIVISAPQIGIDAGAQLLADATGRFRSRQRHAHGTRGPEP